MVFAGCDLGISSAKAAIVDEEGRVKVDKLDMLIFGQWNFWAAGRRVGKMK